MSETRVTTLRTTVPLNQFTRSDMKPQTILLLAVLAAAPAFTQAQSLVERRDQATGWYVPVKMRVTTNGAKAKTVNVQVYMENELIHEIPGSPGNFTLNLDLEHSYTVVLAKEGYRSKSMFINTHVPEQRVAYPMYECFMDLEAEDKFTHSDPFYMDFPGAIVRWDEAAQGFTPQLGYLADIQSKMAMLRVQMDPQ